MIAARGNSARRGFVAIQICFAMIKANVACISMVAMIATVIVTITVVLATTMWIAIASTSIGGSIT